MNLNELTISQTAKGLHNKEFSTVELVSECLNAIEEKNTDLHAYLEIFEDAPAEAKKADKILGESGELPPLFGVPLAIKDNVLIEGKKCTAGSKILENYTANYDAGVIQKLKKQGAIFLGKTNLDEFAMGSSTENSGFGPTKNPHDISRVPGGSSGGSAAAVAANMCIGALGSDTGGSIRQPASFCGIVGFKPTYGTVSRHGLMAMSSSLDQIGPMTKTVEDAKMLFDAIAGKDDFDATSIKLLKSDFDGKDGKSDFSKIKVGVPKEYFGTGLYPEVEKLIKAAIKKIEGAGAEIQEISLPHSEYALAAYYIIVPSEVSANLARYDGIRYGFSITNRREQQSLTQTDTNSLYDVYAKTRAEGFGAEVKRRIMLGTYALSAGYYDAYYLKAQKVRRLISEDFENAFKKVDIIIGPTTPTPAFKFGEHTGNPLEMYLADIYTVAINLAGLPALSLNAGWVDTEGLKLPAGLQLIGERLGDEKLLKIGMGIEKVIE